MNHDLLETLVAASSKLQEAHAKARDAGREDIAQLLRQAQWKVVAALSDAASNKSAEVVS